MEGYGGGTLASRADLVSTSLAKLESPALVTMLLTFLLSTACVTLSPPELPARDRGSVVSAAEPARHPDAQAAPPFEAWTWPEDPRLRSAGLIRDTGRGEVPGGIAPEAEVAQLRRHFAAVQALLESSTALSLETALRRLESARGAPFDPEEQVRQHAALAAERKLQIARLRGYARSGRFPRNPDAGGPTRPIFVDAAGTACAVGFLMRESGWGAAVSAIAKESNGIHVPDVRGGPLVAWVRTSGLTLEEAALIQPAYTPPPPNVDATQILAPGGSIERLGLRVENLEIETDESQRAVATWFLEQLCYAQRPSCPGGTPRPGASPDPAAIDLRIDSDYMSLEGYDLSGEFLFWNASGAGGFANFLDGPPEGLRTRLRFEVSATEPGQRIDSATFGVNGYFWAGAPTTIGSPEVLEPLLISMYVFGGDQLLGDVTIGTVSGDDYPWGSPGPLVGSGTVTFDPQDRITVIMSGILDPGSEWNTFTQTFGIVPIPEPATGSTVLLGLALMALRPRRS